MKKKCKIQGQATALQMPFTFNRKSTNFSSTHVRICVKDAMPLIFRMFLPLAQFSRKISHSSFSLKLWKWTYGKTRKNSNQRWNWIHDLRTRSKLLFSGLEYKTVILCSLKIHWKHSRCRRICPRSRYYGCHATLLSTLQSKPGICVEIQRIAERWKSIIVY